MERQFALQKKNGRSKWKFWKKAAWVALLVLLPLLLFTSCQFSHELTKQESVVALFQKNTDLFQSSVQCNDYTVVKKIPGIQDVYASDHGVVEFSCGGKGFGPSTFYCGFFYFPDDRLTAWNGGICPQDELEPCGKGYLWRQQEGDNWYYVEQIGTHFFYYSAGF